MKRFAPLFFLAALGGLSLAVEYSLNAEGGPDTLGQRVEAAFAAWRSVEGAEVSAERVPDAANLIRYGDGPSFGPDTFSLTVQRTPGPAVEVLLNPTEVSERALLHETGLLLGLSPAPGAQSVMNPALPREGKATLTPADRTALRDLNAFSPEDIDQDGAVDFYDLSELGAAFGQTGVNLPADINSDGTVNGADLELLRAAYAFSAPSETPPEMPGGTSTMTGGAMTGGATTAGSPGGMTGGAMTGGTLSGGNEP